VIDERIPNIDQQSFASRDLRGEDKWEAFTPTYSFSTATGLTVIGRRHFTGKVCRGQVSITGTSFGSTAGASYIDLPIPAKGYGGLCVLMNQTANTSVGNGVVSVSNSRAYLPTQAPSGNSFSVWLEWEI
jgi:hypothetical protein